MHGYVCYQNYTLLTTARNAWLIYTKELRLTGCLQLREIIQISANVLGQEDT